MTVTRVLFLSFFAGLTAFASDIGAFGTWKISRVLDVAPIAAIDEKGAEKLIGTTLQIQKTSFSILGGDGCSTPTYRQEVETRSEYYKAYKMTGNPLKLPATVRTINAAAQPSCHGDPTTLSSNGTVFSSKQLALESELEGHLQTKPSHEGIQVVSWI